MPPTKSERRLHDTIRKLRGELATANATVAHLRRQLRSAAIEVEPVVVEPFSKVATMANAIFQLARVDRSGAEIVVSHIKRRDADCDDDPGAHEPECGQCALCQGFGDCDDNAAEMERNPPVRKEDIR